MKVIRSRMAVSNNMFIDTDVYYNKLKKMLVLSQVFEIIFPFTEATSVSSLQAVISNTCGFMHRSVF